MRRGMSRRLSVQALNWQHYPPGGVARAVGNSLRYRRMTSIHHKDLAEILERRWEARVELVAGWTTERVRGFLALLAVELQRSGTDAARLQLLWDECVAVLQARC